MKSTTLRRSNITREKVAALWQSFGVKAQKNEKAPQVYFVTGLIAGVIITLLITTFISLLINFSTPKDDTIAPVKKPASESSGRFTFIPADSSSSKKGAVSAPINEEYVVKEGDTLESIVIRFYGTFDMDKVGRIQNANKMANPNALSIGQKLIIPITQ